VHVLVVGVPAFRGAQGHRAREDGQEPVAVGDLGDAVRQQHGSQRQQRLPGLGEPQGRPGGTEGDPGEQPAHQDADHDTDDHLPDQLPGEPPCPPLGHLAHGHQEDRGVDEREGETVVEPGLRGQREAHLVALVDLLARLLLLGGGRTPDLDVGGEHRVGGRENGAEQQGRRRGQAHHPPAQERHRGDAQRHRDAQQPPGHVPALPGDPPSEVEGPVESQADAHQGDHDAELGQVLDEDLVVDR
jgi:hypothetical protein